MAYVLCLQMEAWETTAEDALPGLAVYNVHDSPSPAVAPNRAQVSLPGNLALRYEDPCGAACTVVANDIIPRGTKFGPMAGDIFRYVEYRVAIQLAILDRLNHGLNHRPTGFYTGNAPKYAPK